MNRLYVIVLILGILSVYACKEKKEGIIIGTFCGMCQGPNCSQIVKVNGKGAWADPTDEFRTNREDYNYFKENTGIELSKGSHRQLAELVMLLPEEEMKGYDETIGCPDCADQCGVYVCQGKKRWYIDPQDHPVALDPFMQKIRLLGPIFEKEVGHEE